MNLLSKIAITSFALLLPLASHAALIRCGVGQKLVENLVIDQYSSCRASGLVAPKFVAYDGEEGICIISPDQSVVSPGIYRACVKYSSTQRAYLEVMSAELQGAE